MSALPPEERRSVEALSRAYLEAALDSVIMADASGRIVEFNPAAERTFGYSREEALGRSLGELIVPPSLRERHTRAFARFAATGEGKLLGRRLELTGMRADGSEFPVELVLNRVEGEPLLVCGALRDISDWARARDHLRRLATEQAALRRVATLVAGDALPAEVFAAVADEAARVLDVPLTSVLSYESDGTATLVGAAGSENPFSVGERYPPHPGALADVWRTGEPARVEYADVPGEIARTLLDAGITSALGVPIIVDRRTWGVLMALSTRGNPLPDDTEARLADFTELVVTAIANAQAHDDLARLADEQAALRRVATAVARGAGPAEVFTAIAAEVRHVLGVVLVELSRYEPDGTITVIGAAGDHPFQVGTQWPLDGPTISWLVKDSGEAARIDDYAAIPGTIAAAATRSGIRSGLGVPIFVEGELWGAMSIASSARQPISKDIEARLVDFTELAAVAISNTQARGDLERLAEEQAALRRVATLIAREATPIDVFTTVAREVAQTLSVPLTAVVRYEPDGTATQVGAWGRENPFPIGTSWTLDEQSVSGLVARTGKPARVDDYGDVPGGIAATLARKAGIRTAVGVPVLVDGRPWGAMMALSTEQEPIPPGTEKRLAAFTELVATAIANTEARDELRHLLEEQAALRRVATLVAQGEDSNAVFDAVCAEAGELIGATSVNLVHFTPDGFNLTMAGWSVRDTHVPMGTRLALSPDTINGVIWRTGAAARFDSYEGGSSELARLIRQRGIRSEIGAPVTFEGEVWGALIAGTDTDEPLPGSAEQRVASFAELIATAVANATTRSALVASRARIVAAGDEARRRIERDLHDGAQQRLVSLGLDLQAARAAIAPDQRQALTNLERMSSEIESILEDVRELSRGLHPPLLSQGGLRPSLGALARRSPIPVKLDVNLDERPRESIEIAAYFVVSEALANAAKHSSASEVGVVVVSAGESLRVTVTDDGVGGAGLGAGSGLVGLIDRVEALGGRFALESPIGHGTRIFIELPLAPEPPDRLRSPASGSPIGDDRFALEAELSQLADANTMLAAVAAVADALYVVDAEGNIAFLNPAAVRILGYEDKGQLLGRPSHDTIHYVRPDGTPFPAADCPLLRPRVTGEEVRVNEDWFVRQDRSFVPVAYSSAPIDLPGGRGAVVAFRDISKQPDPEQST
jgi:PAS domain S-box-containing protein